MQNVLEQLKAVQYSATMLLHGRPGIRLVAAQVSNGPVWYDYEIRPVRRQITKVEMDKDGLTVSTGSEDFLLTEDGELVGLCNAIAGREVKLIFDPAQVMPEAEALKAAILTNYKSVRRVSISPDCRTAGKSEG